MVGAHHLENVITTRLRGFGCDPLARSIRRDRPTKFDLVNIVDALHRRADVAEELPRRPILDRKQPEPMFRVVLDGPLDPGDRLFHRERMWIEAHVLRIRLDAVQGLRVARDERAEAEALRFEHRRGEHHLPFQPQLGASMPSCSNVQDRGSRSDRQRSNRAACRNRPYWTRSNETSHTSDGSRSTHSVSRPPDHRLCPPGPRPPPKLSPPSSGLTSSRSCFCSAALNDDVCPT